MKQILSRPVARFLGIGVASTAAYAGLFLAFAGPLGPALANLLALVITAIANTAANRRLTFGVRGRDHLLAHHIGGLVMFVIQLAMTDGALALLHDANAHPARALELAVLLIASLAATLTRYAGLSTLVFGPGLHRPVRTLPNQGS